LTRKQKESGHGRAELLLTDRASVWNARPENRQLPSFMQWLQIRWLTRKQSWTPPQRKMMDKAARYHTLRGLVVAGLLALLACAVYEREGRLQAHALREQLLNAKTNEVPGIVASMPPYRRWLDPLLRDTYRQAEAGKDAHKQLHASLALLPVDVSQGEYLYERLLEAESYEVLVIRDALAKQASDLVGRLWTVVEKPEKGKQQERLRAAAALASYDPDSSRWDRVGKHVTSDLVRVPAVSLASWMESFRRVRRKMVPSLIEVYRDSNRRETERYQAADLLAEYVADQPHLLTELLLDADVKEFTKLYPKLSDQADYVLPALSVEVDRKPPPGATDETKEKLAKRQANAAVALLRMNQPAKVWPLLKYRPDPRLRSYLIHRLGPLGADARLLVDRLAQEPDVTIRRALFLSLGPEEFGEEAWIPDEKNLLLAQMQEIYCTEPDPGLHAAAEWLLRQWKQEAWLQQTDEAWAKDSEQRKQRFRNIQQELAHPKPPATGAKPQWYLTGQAQEMVVIPGPVEFVMGSPATEVGRLPEERQHLKRINRTIAIAAKPMTVKQYLCFDKTYAEVYIKHHAPTVDCPVHGITWYMAAAYCNWLSEKEGIPREEWCYETDSQGQVTKLRANYPLEPPRHIRRWVAIIFKSSSSSAKTSSFFALGYGL
jgi:hypothetical protein